MRIHIRIPKASVIICVAFLLLAGIWFAIRRDVPIVTLSLELVLLLTICCLVNECVLWRVGERPTDVAFWNSMALICWMPVILFERFPVWVILLSSGASVITGLFASKAQRQHYFRMLREPIT